MKFGKVTHPENIKFTLPSTHPGTKKVLSVGKNPGIGDIRVGCAKWNRRDLKNFYPRGTKEELEYYASQFNSIEFNATFYRMFPEEQFITWQQKTPGNFLFFPKVPRIISHNRRLKDCERQVDDFAASVLGLGDRLGMVFLQMPNNFSPKNIDRLEPFFKHWPKEISLAAEFRHTDWFNREEIFSELMEIMEKFKITNVITDTAGRRDLLHMRLTTPTAFVRYTGANHATDYTRLDKWTLKAAEWSRLGLQNFYFFVHQNIEKESPFLAAYFIDKLNKKLKTKIKIPKTLKNG